MKETMLEPNNFEWLGGLIQTTDTLFPSGGYAHSYGLEELVAQGRINSAKDLEKFLITDILPALETLELPYLRFCWEAVQKDDFEELRILNEEISAWKLTLETREAGSAQGMQMIRMIREIYNCPKTDAFYKMLVNNQDECQQITATALLRNLQKNPIPSMLIAWIYQAVSNFCSASIKLLRLGEVACQKIIHRCIQADRIRKVISGSLIIKRGNAGFFKRPPTC